MGLWTKTDVAGGMEFMHGQPVALPSLPETIPASPLRLSCDDKPSVRPGDHVQPGDPLTNPTRPQSHHTVAPIAAMVQDVLTIPPDEPNTRSPSHSIVLSPADQQAPTYIERPPPPGRDPDRWFEAMRRVGGWTTIPGMPGLIAQLHAAMQNHPKHLVCIGVDEFSPFPDRSSLLISFAEEAVLGTQLLADAAGAQNAVMLVSNDAQVASRVRRVCHSYRMKLRTVPNLYPAADPTIALNRCLPGRIRLRPRSHPVNEGVMVIEPWSAIRLGRWFNHSRVVMARPITIAWPEKTTPLSTAYALVGQPLATLDERLAATVSRGGRIIAGNPMTGRSVWPHFGSEVNPPTVPEDRTHFCVLPAARAPQPVPCTHCGWCQDVCPTRLRPAELLHQYHKDPRSPALVEPLQWCIECGLCSHVCPSVLPLAQSFRTII